MILIQLGLFLIVIQVGGFRRDDLPHFPHRYDACGSFATEIRYNAENFSHIGWGKILLANYLNEQILIDRLSGWVGDDTSTHR